MSKVPLFLKVWRHRVYSEQKIFTELTCCTMQLCWQVRQQGKNPSNIREFLSCNKMQPHASWAVVSCFLHTYEGSSDPFWHFLSPRKGKFLCSVFADPLRKSVPWLVSLESHPLYYWKHVASKKAVLYVFPSHPKPIVKCIHLCRHICSCCV